MVWQYVRRVYEWGQRMHIGRPHQIKWKHILFVYSLNWFIYPCGRNASASDMTMYIYIYHIYIWHMAACMCRRIVEVTMYISVIAGEAVGFICSRIIVVLASIDDRQYGTHIHTCSAAATTMHIDNDCEHSQHDDTHSVSTITLYTYKCVAHNTYTLNTQKHTDSRSCHIDVSSPSLIGNVYIVKQLKRRDLAEENDNWIYL